MRSSDELFNFMNEEMYQLCLVGEPFYIQLFINYNLFCMREIFIDRRNPLETFWSDKFLLKAMDIQKASENTIIVYCGFDAELKCDYPDAFDFFDFKSILDKGSFEFNGNTYIVDDVKYVASNPEYMQRAYPEVKKGELFDYLQELAKAPAERRIDQSGQICLFDYFSKYINQKNGRRITLNQNISKKNKTIHIFGDSRVSGYMIEDNDLFSNILQDECNINEMHYSVINYGIPGREIDRMEYQVRKAPIAKNDIVFVMTGCYEYRHNAICKHQEFVLHLQRIKIICDRLGAKLCYINLPTTVEMFPMSSDEQTITSIYRNYKFCEYTYETVEEYKEYLLANIQKQGIVCHDLAIDFNRCNHQERLMFINMHHYSPYGNIVIANTLKKIIYTLEENDYSSDAAILYKESIKQINNYVASKKKCNSIFHKTRVDIGGLSNLTNKNGCFRLFLWMHGIMREIFKKKHNNAKYGAIVMNANPFTNGHRYLVEYASKNVDHLYVFVLSEDKSEFPYDDRIRMVYLGCRDLKNVTVTSGGASVISNKTFPEYFMKKELQDKEISAYKDIEMFGTVVAPPKGITIRFVGEEPFDKVTKQYNSQMKQYLPRFGIELYEIPRLKLRETTISASEVRKAIEMKDWDSIQMLVPATTYNYLKKVTVQNHLKQK